MNSNENSQEQEGIVNPTSQNDPNPARIFIEWKSKNKCFSYYHKEKKENVMLPMPFSFIPLYKCVTVKGYNHKKNKTFIANEVLNAATDIITVTSYNNLSKEKKVEHKGLYEDIKEDFDNNVKYTVSLYAALKNKKGELSLVNLQLNGASLHHYFDFENSSKMWGNSVKVSEYTSEKNGDVDYFAPKYTTEPISKEDNIACGKLQKEITAYLKDYFAKNASNTQQVGQTSVNSQKEVEKGDKNPASNSATINSTTFGDSDDLPF